MLEGSVSSGLNVQPVWWYSEFSLFRNTHLEELSSRTSVHVGTLDSAQLLPGEGRDSPFPKGCGEQFSL